MKKSNNAVETKDLSISWGEVNVLNQINFELNNGEKLAIVGPSGSGKSTILKILAGLVLPTKGELRIFGEKQTYLRLDQNNPPDVRLVFQNPALLGSLTIEENVGFILQRNKNLSKKFIQEIVRECLGEGGLNTPKDIITDPCLNKKKILPRNLSPFAICAKLQDQSIPFGKGGIGSGVGAETKDGKYSDGTAGFFFYETARGFNFRSIDGLMDIENSMNINNSGANYVKAFRDSAGDEMPETSEKKTNGTTKSFNRFRKMSPPKLKIY